MLVQFFLNIKREIVVVVRRSSFGVITRTRTNTNPNDTEANAAGRSGNARALRKQSKCGCDPHLDSLLQAGTNRNRCIEESRVGEIVQVGAGEKKKAASEGCPASTKGRGFLG